MPIIRLPRFHGAAPAERAWPPSSSSVRGLIIAGFSLLVLIAAFIAAGSAWLTREHRSDLAEMQARAATVALLQQAEADGAFAMALVQRYIATGDDTGIDDIRASLATTREAMERARVQEEKNEDVEEAARLSDLIAGIDAISQILDEVTDLRQSGDVRGASEALTLATPLLEELRLTFGEAAEHEQEEVSALRTRVDQASKLAFWFAIVAGAAAAGAGLGASLLIARSILKPLSSLESTALAVADGHLEARAPTAGPRELAHLGKTMNRMVATVETRTEELRLANEELRERNRQLLDARTQAATDALTGLRNHRAFHLRIKDEVPQSQKSGSPVGLIMLDIDGFKAVNDSLGHLAGDDILRDVAFAVTQVVPQGDAYRYGGDEFVVIVPAGDRQRTTRTAEDVRRAVARGADGADWHVTISLGVASYPDTAASAEELVYGADAAMYWAKSAGKNRIGDWHKLSEAPASDRQEPAAEPRDGAGSPGVPTGPRT